LRENEIRVARRKPSCSKLSVTPRAATSICVPSPYAPGSCASVGEVRLEADVELEQPLFRRVVPDDDVLVHAVGHEAVSLDRQRGVLAFRRRHDAAREVVDGAARQDLQRLPVDQEPPLRKVADVRVEEPFGRTRQHVAVFLRQEERAAVEQQQVRHRGS
jgi:hypothetical protein